MTATSHSFLAGCRSGGDYGISELPVRQRTLAIGPWLCRRSHPPRVLHQEDHSPALGEAHPECSSPSRAILEFTEAGRVVLAVEGPLFTRRFARTEFELRGGDGLPLKGRTTLLRAHSSTFSRIRMEMKSYDLPMPGRYELRLLNLGASQPRDNEHQIVFMKPHLPQLVVAIVGIIGSSFLLIGSIVLFLLRSFGI